MSKIVVDYGNSASGGEHIEYGEVYQDNMARNTWYDIAVTFDKPFSSAPDVCVEWKYQANPFWDDTYRTTTSVYPTNITTTGFTMKLMQNQTSAADKRVTARYIAKEFS